MSAFLPWQNYTGPLSTQGCIRLVRAIRRRRRRTYYVYRSAITGRFVSEKYAKANPETTVDERIRR